MSPSYYPPPDAEPTNGRPWPDDRVRIANAWATVEQDDYWLNSWVFPLRFDHRSGVVQMRLPSEIQQRISTRATVHRLTHAVENTNADTDADTTADAADATAATAPAEVRERNARQEGVA